MLPDGSWTTPYFDYEFSTPEWENTSYRTVNFGLESQEVSKEFYEWFTANAVQQTSIELQPTLITFTIDANLDGHGILTLTAEEDMTWDEWIGSKYNTIGMQKQYQNMPEGVVAYAYSAQIWTTENVDPRMDVLLTDKIISNCAYWVSHSGGTN